MNKKTKQLLEDARSWADEQYELKGGEPGTDLYFKNKHRAMIELINHIEATQTEQRENGQLQS
jgi:hypothetical protein